METTDSTTTATPKRKPGHTLTGNSVTIFVGDRCRVETYRADDGDLVITFLDETNYTRLGSVRLTSDEGEAHFFAAITEAARGGAS